MQIFNVIVSTLGGTAALLILLAWLFREWITVRLRASVEHEFDEKLEEIKKENRASETRLKASVQHDYDAKLEAMRTDYRATEARYADELRNRSATVETLRNEMLRAVSTRRDAIEKRRLIAYETIWKIVVRDLNALSGPANTLTAFNYSATAEASAGSQKMQAMFKGMLPNNDAKIDLRGRAAKGQPYVTPRVWALFLAHYSIVQFGWFQMKLLADGINMPKLINTEGIEKIISAALPHQATYIKQYGASVYGWLLGEIEITLLAEIQTMLEGKNAAAETLATTVEVMTATHGFDAQLREQSPSGAIAAATAAGAVPSATPPPEPTPASTPTQPDMPPF